MGAPGSCWSEFWRRSPHKFTTAPLPQASFARYIPIVFRRTFGATGVRILTAQLSEMHRRQSKYGLETMGIGGGQGLAAIFERV